MEKRLAEYLGEALKQTNVTRYSPFMKFKQSEDGQEGHDGTGDTWQDRYNMLHKRYMGVLEQKSFLEELTASQEKALQAAAAAQQEQQCLQQEAKQQQRQYEAVVLELQAQVRKFSAIDRQ
nr:hypothetical protein BaRGS_005232 [Batillaria attramentaria]